MNIGYVFLIAIAGMAYFVSDIPTPDEMIANFDAAQKFYTSGAYDQALEAYEIVNDTESRFVDEENVIVEFGTMQIPVKDATMYKTGGTYFKLIQEENRMASEAADDQEKERHNVLALEYADKATEYFNLTQQQTANDDLKAQSQNQIIAVWYEVNDYDRVILEGEKLIELYGDSPYVLDAMYNIGWAYFDKKEYDQAIEVLNALVEQFPSAGFQSERALFQIGESYYEKKEYEEAITYYQQLVDKMRINELTDQEITRIQRDKLAGLTNETSLDLAAKAQLKVGACYASLEEFDSASAAYKRVAQLFRFDQGLISEAYQRLADMYLDRGDLDASISAYRDAIDEVPDEVFSAKMQVLIAHRYFDYERYDDAVREYTHYINTYSSVAPRAGFNVDEAMLRQAQSYYELGNQQMRAGEEAAGRENILQAIPAFDRMIRQFPDSDLKTRMYFYRGMALQRLGDPDNTNEAIRYFNMLLTEDPETPYKQYTYFFIARAYQTLQNYDEAINYYKRVLDEFPDTPQKNSAYMEIAVAYRDSGRDDLALDYFLMVSPDDPKLYTSARLLAAQYLLQEEEYQRLISVVSESLNDKDAIESDYRLAQFYIMRGNAYKSLEQYESSIQDFQRAVDLNEENTRERALIYLSGVLIEINEFARAEAFLKELLSSTDEGVARDARMRLAIISVRQNKSEQAILTYQDLYDQSTDPIEKLDFLRNLMMLSSQASDWDRLLRYADLMINSEDAEGKKPENAEFFYKEEAYFNKAVMYERQGDYQSARDVLVQAYAIFPNSYYSSDLLLKLGMYYLTSLAAEPNAIDIAAEYFDKYVTNFPNAQNAEIAMYYQGLCYYNGRRFEEADKTFREFERRYPNSEFTPEAIYYYADANYNLGNMDASISAFDRLINRYPNHKRAQDALYTKAWALMDLGREDESMQALVQLYEKYPQSPQAPHSVFSIADFYYNRQEYSLAMEYYQKVIDEYPESEVAEKIPETIEELTETIAYLEYDEAMVVFTSARETNNLEEYRQAAALLTAVAEKYPNTESGIGSWSNAGFCYEALEQWQQAVNCYQQVIEIYESGGDVTLEAFNYARSHMQYIEANKF